VLETTAVAYQDLASFSGFKWEAKNTRTEKRAAYHLCTFPSIFMCGSSFDLLSAVLTRPFDIKFGRFVYECENKRLDIVFARQIDEQNVMKCKTAGFDRIAFPHGPSALKIACNNLQGEPIWIAEAKSFEILDFCDEPQGMAHLFASEAAQLLTLKPFLENCQKV